MSHVFVGSRVAAEVQFRIAGVLTDATVVVATLRAPDGTLTSATFPAADLTRPTVGTYRLEFTAETAGQWGVRFKATGTVEAVGENTILVHPSAVI